jgi:hypothetical protein
MRARVRDHLRTLYPDLSKPAGRAWLTVAAPVDCLLCEVDTLLAVRVPGVAVTVIYCTRCGFTGETTLPPGW